MRPTPRKRQSNISPEERDAIKGEAIDDMMVGVFFRTIEYAQSFRSGTWNDGVLSALFEVRDKFAKN